MSNYNTQLQSNNTDLQTVLQTLQSKAAGGEQATPEISVNSSTGLITATAGTKSSTYQLAFQAAKTITPSTVSQIAVSSGYYTGGNITVAGDANLVAENIKSGVSIFGVSGTLEEGGGSGEAAEWSENEDAIISRTITEYANNRITSIGSYAFYDCSTLTTANFPQVTTIGGSAFQSCYSLATVSFPAATTIGSEAFQQCSSLTTANFPQVTSIGRGAFNVCYSLSTISFPQVTTIDNYTFRSCRSLTTVNFPQATIIGYYAFQYCSSLTTANFPACTTISTYAFEYCRRLSQLYLTGPSVCTLGNSNAFSSTPYAGYSNYFSGIPYIYVPSSLLTSYQTATNWTYFSSYFSAVENSPAWEGGIEPPIAV